MTWEKLPPFAGEVHHGCATCGGTELVAPLDMLVCVGFGSAVVTRDGEEVWAELSVDDEQETHDVLHFENLAAADPDHDWRIDIQGPLRGRTYQRHDAARWVLVDSNAGFA